MAESVSNPLAINASENQTAKIISDEIRSTERKSAFLAEKYTEAGARSELSYRSNADKAAKSAKLPMDTNSILAELRRDYMHSNLTARDIATRYEISYLQARNIYVALHQDANGIVKETNLPNNSTVSYLV